MGDQKHGKKWWIARLRSWRALKRARLGELEGSILQNDKNVQPTGQAASNLAWCVAPSSALLAPGTPVESIDGSVSTAAEVVIMPTGGLGHQVFGVPTQAALQCSPGVTATDDAFWVQSTPLNHTTQIPLLNAENDLSPHREQPQSQTVWSNEFQTNAVGVTDLVPSASDCTISEDADSESDGDIDNSDGSDTENGSVHDYSIKLQLPPSVAEDKTGYGDPKLNPILHEHLEHM
ncbi:hypothetical protein EDC04DRAFT_2899101 [Pisolithus marmoratus]|nr:hypothetical protein EDC04DRAFT_2899101 [Pisolithus marmoratus]